MKLLPAIFHINSITTMDTRTYLRLAASFILISFISASIYEYEETSTNQVSTIGSRTNKALTFPWVNAKHTSILHIITSSYEPSSVVSVKIYQNQSESSINNSSIHVSNITFTPHNETTGSTDKRHSTLITAIIVSIIAILCIVGLIYLYKRKYNPTWCSKADTNSAMSIQDRPQQKDEHDYMTVYDIDAPQHENPSFVIEQNKDKNYDKLRRPDQDTNDYDKLQESTSQKYENSAKKHKLNTDLANQLQESLKYENSETNATKDFKSQSNLGESIASKLYESIDNCNSDSLTESTPYAYIE